MASVGGYVAGIDVHKRMVAVVVRREENRQLEYEKRKFGTTRTEIEHLWAWLQHLQVGEVVMESTAQYWRPIWYGLEGHFRLHLTHPLETRAPRGRKRDWLDAQRLADRWQSGDLKESFIPAAEQRGWRWLTRTRLQLQRRIGVVRNQVEGLLEQGGMKLTAVVSDPFGVSGWAMLQLIARGETDVEVLVQQARAALRNKQEQLREALRGGLDEIGRKLLQQSLEQVALLRRHIEEINGALAVAMKEHTATLVRLTRIPGVDLPAAQQLLAEIGPAAARFVTAGQFASWAGICPGSNESGGVDYSQRSAKGNRYLRRLLCQVAWAAIRAKDSFFSRLFMRLKPRLGAKSAMWAVSHRVGRVVWLLLHEGVEYEEKGVAPPSPGILVRKLRRLMRDFARAGLDAKAILADTPAAAPA